MNTPQISSFPSSSCQALQYYRDLPFEQETVSVLKKFLNCLPLDVQNSITQLQNKVVFWIPDRHCDSPLLKPIFSVVVNHHAATIRYSSTHSESTRTIIPIGLYAMNGLWYCPAYCTTAGQIRVFRSTASRKSWRRNPILWGIIDRADAAKNMRTVSALLQTGIDYFFF